MTKNNPEYEKNGCFPIHASYLPDAMIAEALRHVQNTNNAPSNLTAAQCRFEIRIITDERLPEGSAQHVSLVVTHPNITPAQDDRTTLAIDASILPGGEKLMDLV